MSVEVAVRGRTLGRAMALGAAAWVGLLAAAAPTVAAAAEPGPPALAVSPADGLVDGQIVDVAVSSGPPRDYVFVVQCGPASQPGGPACDDRTRRQIRILPDGTYETPKKLTAILETPAGRVDCRWRPPTDPCTVGLRTDAGALLAHTPVRFRPWSPLEWPATLRATPAAGVLDGQEIHVRGQGYDVGVGLHVFQCRAGATGPSACRPVGGRPPLTSPAGLIERDLVVHAVFTAIDFERVDCRRPWACELVTFHTRWDQPPARTPLFFAPGQHVAEPTVVLEPASGLVDQQPVTVRATGFPAGASVDVVVCTPSGACPAIAGYRTADADGRLTIEGLALPARVPADGTDCRQGGCTLVLRAWEGRFPSARLALGFDPGAPLGPAPVLTVDPATGVVPGQPVTLTAGHLWPGQSISLYQCPASAPGDPGHCSFLPSYPPVDDRGEVHRVIAADPLVTSVLDPSAVTDCRVVAGGCVLVLRAPGVELTAPIAFAAGD